MVNSKSTCAVFLLLRFSTSHDQSAIVSNGFTRISSKISFSSENNLKTVATSLTASLVGKDTCLVEANHDSLLVVRKVFLNKLVGIAEWMNIQSGLGI